MYFFPIVPQFYRNKATAASSVFFGSRMELRFFGIVLQSHQSLLNKLLQNIELAWCPLSQSYMLQDTQIYLFSQASTILVEKLGCFLDTAVPEQCLKNKQDKTFKDRFF